MPRRSTRRKTTTEVALDQEDREVEEIEAQKAQKAVTRRATRRSTRSSKKKDVKEEDGKGDEEQEQKPEENEEDATGKSDTMESEQVGGGEDAPEMVEVKDEEDEKKDVKAEPVRRATIRKAVMAPKGQKVMGMPVSGQPWKPVQHSKSSGMLKWKATERANTYERRMAEKARRKRVKEYEADLKRKKDEELERQRARRAEVRKRREANQARSEKLQKITKKSTIKKMNKKSYRMLVRRASQKGPEAYY